MFPNFCYATEAVSTSSSNHAAAPHNIVFSNRAAAMVTQHDMEKSMRCRDMVIKSDQTVVGNFHVYTNNLDIQAVGISNIAHITAL